MIRNNLSLIFALMALLTVDALSQQIKLTANSEAETLYQKGWRLIMDEGRYHDAGLAFGQAYEQDDHFVLAALTYARTLEDPEQIKEIMTEVSAMEYLSKEEELLKGVYLDLVELTIARYDSTYQIQKDRPQILKDAQASLFSIVKNYKNEPYYLSEYIEVIHAIFGSQAALDSLQSYDSRDYQIPLFLRGYKATLLIEQGKCQEASDQINSILFNKRRTPKYYVLKGELSYCKSDQENRHLRRALKQVNRALNLDAKNVDAQRLKIRIEDRRR